MAALIHAAGVVHSYDVTQAGGGDGFFYGGVNFDGARQWTCLAARANKDVMAVLSHWATR